MNRETTKSPYCKPAIRVVKWDFNENICNSVITNSLNVQSCIKVKSKGSVTKFEERPYLYSNPEDDWAWTGSR